MTDTILPYNIDTISIVSMLMMTSSTFVFEFVAGRTTEMSAEPGRTAPYGNDLRWRVVWQHIQARRQGGA